VRAKGARPPAARAGFTPLIVVEGRARGKEIPRAALSHPQFGAASLVARTTAATAASGLTFIRSSMMRPMVKALHCLYPRLLLLVLHHIPGRYRRRATSPTPTSSQYASASTNSNRSIRSGLVSCVRRRASHLTWARVLRRW